MTTGSNTRTHIVGKVHAPVPQYAMRLKL